ncbi:MAG TPA: ABC transporter substrate-binding protein, partial [Dehalococcoidia bacterium]|nr:ABC transporter substrate-binding protein [Dehalococcoidia bacterium]
MVGFDPNNTTSGYDNQLNAMYYNGLVWNCYGIEVCPDIAKSWKYTADGKALVFELNNNVKWQKGVKDGVVTAKDVKFSFDKIMGKVEGFTQSERIGWMTNYVTSIDVVDDFTVRFNVVRPAAILPVMMTVGFGSVIPAGTTYDQMKTSKIPLGSGPFMIKEHVRGSIYKVVRNPDYFKPGLPYLDGVDMVIIGDANAREAAVLTGVIEIFR